MKAFQEKCHLHDKILFEISQFFESYHALGCKQVSNSVHIQDGESKGDNPIK